MPAAAKPHLNALFFQLLDATWGGAVVISLRPVGAAVLSGARELFEKRSVARAPLRNIVVVKMMRVSRTEENECRADVSELAAGPKYLSMEMKV